MLRKIKLTIFILFISVPLSATFADPGSLNNPTNPGKVYYHLTFPVSVSEQTERLDLNQNYTDLIMSNYVAGAMLAHLLHKHFPNLKFDNQYIQGTLLAQLLQENLQTSDYQASSDWINPNPAIRNMLLSPGQGGPYQLNDYSKRLEHQIGLINYAVLQKSLGYTIQDQDSGTQTSRPGPALLDNKYFAPLAAAYFQYNDLLRIQSINKDPWGPSAPYFSQCLSNLENTPNNFLDMILNATYNAGPWANITTTYIELCANINNPAYTNKLKYINDYSLDDHAYQQATGTKESAGSTFILYPRQIRFYLDELYNNPTNLQTTNNLIFPVQQLRSIFAKALSTLAYVNQNGHYQFIDQSDTEKAFDNALTSLKISPEQALNMGNTSEKNQIFLLLETSIDNVANSLKIDFTEVTEKNLGS